MHNQETDIQKGGNEMYKGGTNTNKKYWLGLALLPASLLIVAAACSDAKPGTVQQQAAPRPYSSPSLKQAIRISPDTAPTAKSQAISPATFQIDKLSIEPSSISAGDKVIITAVVNNIGGGQGVYNAELRVDGVVEIANQITLESGQSKTLSFYAFRDIPGTYEVTFGDRAAQFTVTQPPEVPITAAAAPVASPAGSDPSLPACHLPGGQNGGAAAGASAGGCCATGTPTGTPTSATTDQNPTAPARPAAGGCCGAPPR